MNDTNQLPQIPDLTNERIDYIADLTVKGMPDGIRGFLVSWGWRQFARALMSNFDETMRAYALQARAQVHPAQAEVTDEKILKTLRPDVWMHVEGLYREQMLADARAILALRPVQVPMTPLTDAQMEKGRDQIFSINNPYCPCDRKTFKKVAQWVERHHRIGITAQAKKETP